MVRKLLFTGLGSTLLLGGCTANTSQVPMATTYPYSEQQKMQAAQHWDVLAEHESPKPLPVTDAWRADPVTGHPPAFRLA